MMDISLGRYYKELDKIPLKKGETPSGVEFLTEMEIRTLFEQPDTATKKGVRDLLLMIMLYDSADTGIIECKDLRCPVCQAVHSAGSGKGR